MAVNIITTKQKPWVGQGSEKEIEREALPKDKPARTKMHFSARRELFLKRKQTQQTFTNRDAVDEQPMYLRPQKASSKDQWLYRQEIDIGVRAVRPTTAGETQTPYYRKVTVAIQAEPSVVDARVEAGKEEPNEGPLRKFFDKVLPRVMHHLTQNNEVPIFGDDYLDLADEDAFVGSREENYLREAGNFFHHYTRDRQITSIDWRPGKSTVAVAVMAQATMQERFEAARDVKSSVCIVWNFNEQANPQFFLEAPAEVLALRFCPTDPNIIVGGLINGQVVMWNLNIDADGKTRHSKHAHKARQTQQDEDVTAVPTFEEPKAGQTLEKSGDHMVWRLQPQQISRIEYSHRRAVHDICWLPAELECGFDGKFVDVKDSQNQFATIGEDGVMYLWDLRPENQPDQKLKRLKSSRIPGDPLSWAPLLKWVLQKPEGGGDLIGLRFHLECKDDEGKPKYLMCCTTAEGEFATCYWGPKEEKQSAQSGFDDMARREAKVVRSLAPAHAGPGWSVQRHPTLHDYYLTVGDWGFKIWQVGLSSPILASPLSDQQITCGRWSPTRPAVLFIGTREGFLQVWDLLDRSHEKLFEIPVIGDQAITVLEFKPISDRRGAAATQHLVVGTKPGDFRLYELPKKLTKAHQSEARQTQHFFERESRRVAYFAWRWKERTREMDLKLQEKGDATRSKGDADGDAAEEEADYMMAPEDDTEFMHLVQELGDADEETDVIEGGAASS